MSQWANSQPFSRIPDAIYSKAEDLFSQMKKKKIWTRWLPPIVYGYFYYLITSLRPFLEADSPLLGGGGGRRAQRPPPEHRQGIRQNLDHSFLTHEDIEEG